jgi:hypothetical protein
VGGGHLPSASRPIRGKVPPCRAVGARTTSTLAVPRRQMLSDLEH